MSTSFGALLKTIREGQRTSQSKLAERAGFDHSYVSRLESGARTPTRFAVDALAEALAASEEVTARLMMAAGYMPTSRTAFYATPELARLDAMMRYLAMNDEEVYQHLITTVTIITNGIEYAVSQYATRP